MDFLEQNAIGVVTGAVVYMICLYGIGVDEILEKWFGSGVHKYEPEVAFIKVVIIFALFVGFSKPNPGNVESDNLWSAFLVALACAVIHKLAILWKQKKQHDAATSGTNSYARPKRWRYSRGDRLVWRLNRRRKALSSW